MRECERCERYEKCFEAVNGSSREMDCDCFVDSGEVKPVRDFTDREAYKTLKLYHDVVIGDDGSAIDKAMTKALKELDKEELPEDLEWYTNSFSDELTCPCCMEVLKRNYFNNFCANCGAKLKGGDK